jgi:hypothetical protein
MRGRGYLSQGGSTDMKEVKIRIKKDGTTEIETSGFKGNECLEETDRILKQADDLGISLEVKDRKKKAEYYEQPVTTGIRTGY